MGLTDPADPSGQNGNSQDGNSRQRRRTTGSRAQLRAWLIVVALVVALIII